MGKNHTLPDRVGGTYATVIPRMSIPNRTYVCQVFSCQVVICHTYEQTFDCYSVVTVLDLGIDRTMGRDYDVPMTFTPASGHFTVVYQFEDGTICYNGRMATYADAAAHRKVINAIMTKDVRECVDGIMFIGASEDDSIVQQGHTMDDSEYNGWKVSL